MFFVKPKKFLGFGRHKPIVELSIAQIHPRPQAHPPLTVEFCCRVAKHIGQINRSLLHAANSNPRGENAESAPRAASCQVLRLLFLLCSSAAGQGCRWYVAAEGGGCALRRGVVVAARRDEVPLACCSGGCFLRFTPRGIVVVARRGGVFAGVLQRVVLSVFCAAQGVALSRGPRGAAAAFLASLMRR